MRRGGGAIIAAVSLSLRARFGATLPSSPRASLGSIGQRVGAAWRFDAGKVNPPSDRAKRRHLQRVFTQRGHAVLVESGTYLGGTVQFMLPFAERIISVEIEPALHEAARRRFAAAPNVDLRLGDGAELIPRIVSELDQAPLLWLDGHFTGGVNTRPGAAIEPAPMILERLGTCPPGTTIVVDDLRLFGRDNGFPGVDVLVGSARTAFPAATIRVGLDSLVILA
jgi:hypothetical protein